jgi:hypothetical protein
MSTPATTTLPFPHPILTPVLREPTNKSLQLLQQELYANARAIHSTRGGGNNGHLALIMPDELYFTRTGHAFLAPQHPGDHPVHLPGATQAQITETNRQYAADLVEHTRFTTVGQELKKQILNAVAKTYLHILSDADFGFADVSCTTMLAHLKSTYGKITPEELEANRSMLSAVWNPDDPMEDFWVRIKEVQCFATAGHEPLSDAAIMRLTLPVFEATGVFTSAVEKWRDMDEAEWTMSTYQRHFQKANKERIRKLTAQTAGYIGAHAAIASHPPALPAPIAATTTPAPTPFQITTDGQQFFYCWSHGLGTNRSHTSATCNRPSPGHQLTATASHMLGGNNTILRGGQAPRGGTPVAPTTAPL